MQFRHLFEPGRLGKHETKNRIWMTAHATLLVKDHLFTDEHIAYYVERARGGVGVITMEAMAAHPTTQPYKSKAFAFDPRIVPQFQKIARAVRPHGTKIMAQSWHRGRQTNSVTNGLPVWAPSSIPCSIYREMPHAMTEAEIAEIVEGYRLCARHARQGELDGIEVAGTAHGYLLNQFLSPATNHRTDRYGGSFENRLRIVLEILQATREEIGPDLVVGMRMNSDDGMDGGLDPQAWAQIARRIEGSGLVDYISCSQGTYLNRMMIFPSSPEQHGFQLPATRVIKQSIGLPVVGVGRIVTPEEAETFLQDGSCDFIGLSRALIADPMWAEKARTGRSASIRRCVGANWCLETLFAQAPIGCIYNPAAGAEKSLGEGTLTPAARKRKVAVVGGGPAGLQAALTAATRGLDVTLFEQRAALGGQVAWWARAKVGQELAFVVDFLSTELGKTEAKIELNHAAGCEELQSFDDIIVATGAEPLRHGWSPLRPKMWNGETLPGVRGRPRAHDRRRARGRPSAGARGRGGRLRQYRRTRGRGGRRSLGRARMRGDLRHHSIAALVGAAAHARLGQVLRTAAPQERDVRGRH